MAWTDYTPRFLTPTQIERDRDTPLSLTVYYGSAAVTPTSGTVTVYDVSGVEVVSAAAVTITGSAATYTVLASAVSGKSFGAGWRVEWSLTMPDTYVHLFRNDAALVKVRYSPQVTDQDLYDLHPELASFLPSGSTSWQAQRERAHANVYGRLEARGRAPYLIVSRSSIKPIELYESLSIICLGLSGTGSEDNKWSRLAEHYRQMAERAFDGANFTYDDTGDGVTATRRTPARASVWLTSRSGAL
jgi:hypothetical protein